MRLSHVLTALLLCFCSIGQAQTHTYYGSSWHNDSSPTSFWYGYSKLHKLTISNGNCSDQTIGIFLGAPNDSLLVRELCHCPDNFLYASALDDSSHIYKVNPATAQIVSTITLNDNIGGIRGMVCDAANKIYAAKGFYNIKRFVEIDPTNGNVTTLGTSTESFGGDLIQHDSVWYSIGIARMDLDTDSITSELLFVPDLYQNGLSVFPGPCNTFVTLIRNNTATNDVYLTNIDQHTSTLLCQTTSLFQGLAREGGDYYDPEPSCPVPIDLDRNDNSGATGSAFNSDIFNCKINGVPIADNDAFIPSYPIIDTMWVSITGGLLDVGNERLSMGLPPTGIAVSGNFSTTIMLTNASGNARVPTFLTALKSIQYKNLTLSPTGGTREITVSFVTRQGFPTDTATCFVQVQQLPQVPVNLGPDRGICQGSSTVIDAGNPGHTYYWASGQTTRTITASIAGTYKVTVSDGIKCPGEDAIKISVLPNQAGSIDGPYLACAGDSVSLIFNCNCTDTFDFVVGNNLGYQDTLIGVVDGTELRYYLPYNPNNTLYDLNFVFEQLNSSQSTACIGQLWHRVWVNPANYTQNDNAFICQGDSINLGGIWQTAPGTYTHQITTPFGCGITINTTLYVGTPGNQTVHINQTTCDPALAGIFTQNLTNIGGCDSTVITTVTLLSDDTVFVNLKTCDPSLVGTTIQNLTNSGGCDSIIVTSVELASDIFVGFQHQATTCLGDSVGIEFFILGPGSFDFTFTDLNSGQTEVIQDVSNGYVHFVSPTQEALYWPQQLMEANPDGCLDISNFLPIDVIQPVFTNNAFVLCEGDSIYVAGAWQTESGSYVDSLSTQLGCDSIVTSTILLNIPSDTVFVASQTCDPTLAGVFTQDLTSLSGCDSTVITTVTLISSDTFFVASQTCDPALAGVYTQDLTSLSGCDSTIVTTVTLVSSDTVFVASQTCDPTLAGVFTQDLTNSSGCDSTVITTVTLVSSDTVFLVSQTCDPTLAGVFTQTLPNAMGCDSTTITTITLLSSDTVSLASQTCDPALTGVFTQTLPNAMGCDSTVITTVTLLSSDTVFITSQTCDPTLAGVFTQDLTSLSGCDSTVITTVTLATSDTVFLASQTCDPTLAGVFTQDLTSSSGCDSLVVTTVELLVADTVTAVEHTCEPEEVGVLYFHFFNWQGCDSTVILITELLPKDSCGTQVPDSSLQVYVPNVFSPNDDGVNDYFWVYSKVGQPVKFNLRVFSRWGELIFELRNGEANQLQSGWDGKFRGRYMDTGVYLYFIEVVEEGKPLERLKGEVHLLR